MFFRFPVNQVMQVIRVISSIQVMQVIQVLQVIQEMKYTKKYNSNFILHVYEFHFNVVCMTIFFYLPLRLPLQMYLTRIDFSIPIPLSRPWEVAQWAAVEWQFINSKMFPIPRTITWTGDKIFRIPAPRCDWSLGEVSGLSTQCPQRGSMETSHRWWRGPSHADTSRHNITLQQTCRPCLKML